MSLNIIDLAAGVSGVCRSWRAACSDPMLWRETDFNTMNESDLFNIPRGIGAWSDQGIKHQALEDPKEYFGSQFRECDLPYIPLLGTLNEWAPPLYHFPNFTLASLT